VMAQLPLKVERIALHTRLERNSGVSCVWSGMKAAPAMTCSSVDALVSAYLALSASASNTVFIWNGVSPGCLPRMRAMSPVTCGAAKLFPVARMVLPPSHPTSRSIPGAPNSTGGDVL
jgi:hypothetical protein